MNRRFNILSIDGGGIKGIFPAKFLAQLENELERKGFKNYKIHENFDLICGTSTGGIIAIALALGIPAKEIHQFYLEHAAKIFRNRRSWYNPISLCYFLKGIPYSTYSNRNLEELIRNKFKQQFNGNDPYIKDCKTNICIPYYDYANGKPSVLKNDYHPNFVRDYHIPAYQAAMATSAAPTYFDPYSSYYTDFNGEMQSYSQKVDGGVFANNPTLIGIIEAKEAFKMPLKDLNILSIGTGVENNKGQAKRKRWGAWYWGFKKNIINLLFQAQSQNVENLLSLLQNGIDKERSSNPTFIYKRINTVMTENDKVDLDDTDSEKLLLLSEKAKKEFDENATTIISNYCNNY